MNIHERIVRMLIRRRPDLKYSDQELKEFDVTFDELNEYKNTHPEILDTTDEDSLVNFSYKLMNEFYQGQHPFTLTRVEDGGVTLNDARHVGVFEIRSGGKSDYTDAYKDDRVLYVKDILYHLVGAGVITDDDVEKDLEKYNHCLYGIYLIEKNENTNNGDYDKIYKIDNTIADHGKTFVNYQILRDIAKQNPESFSDDGFHYLCMSLIGRPVITENGDVIESNKVVLIDPAILEFVPKAMQFSERIKNLFK